MTDKTTDPAATEISPEQAALLARRVRVMMVIAGFTTAIGMAAILITVGYSSIAARARPRRSAISRRRLPKGARITSTAVSADRVVVTVETPAGLEVRTFDARTLKLTGRLRFATEP